MQIIIATYFKIREKKIDSSLINFRFLKDFCDIVCRCGGTVRQEARPYESITGQVSDDDDHMLNL
jgi:hypothetical protein